MMTKRMSAGDGQQPPGACSNNNAPPLPPPSTTTSMTISSKPTLITTPNLRFLIMDAPRQSNLHLYIKECRRHHVTDIVRVCEPTYLGAELKSAGIELHEMAYEDGHSPSEEILGRWLDLVEGRFFGSGGGGSKDATIAVHCVAGLGRAPVLVAIALMEFEKMDAVEAVMMIRRNRRGAINEKQLQYLEGYKCRRGGGGGGCACVIL
mmetsp:Transcript_10933/g.24059  ORF Transcript_10933/g.24059 Transcript_10933/m.24059 type:complete len:207 (+) Transcript_10933:2707-3327(+)|eukprot:g3912.t1 g3912   contig13:470236-470856(+)